MPKWFFPKLGGGEEQGLNDAGIEEFKRGESLARETCQNIGDVRDDSGKPAIATFELLDLHANEFPGLDEFKSMFMACRNSVLTGLSGNSEGESEGPEEGPGNERAFFEKGLDILNGDKIRVLRIGDENTTGLVGTDTDRSSPFYRLLKLQGASTPQGVGGGTYGIGQRAPFAHSALRTVFYSTRTNRGHAFIGKSILASFQHPETGGMTQSKGWWCNPTDSGDDWSTLRDVEQIPSRFIRETIGTDIWVTGFQRTAWETSVRRSVLQHFFAAIAQGKLIVQIIEGGGLVSKITRENLESELLRAAEEARTALDADEYQKGIGSTIYFYKALEQPYGGKPFEEQIDKIGIVKLYLYRDPENRDLPDRWATMRKPMIIVETFSSGLLNRFAAVLVCDNDEGNNYLAQLENATHERWSAEETRNWTELQKEEAKKIISQVKRFVRDTLKAVRGDDMTQQQDIPFLGRYLPAEEDEAGRSTIADSSELSGDTTENETGERRTRDRAEPVTGVARPTLPTTTLKPTIGTSAGAGENDSDGGDEPGGGTGEGNGGGGVTPGAGEMNQILSPAAVHFRSYRSGDGYRVILTATEDLIGDLKLVAVGEDSNEAMEVDSAEIESTGEELAVKQTRICDLVLPVGEKITLKVKVNNDMGLCLTMGR